MNPMILTARLDIQESLRSRWFLLFCLVFGAIVSLLMVSGLTESRVMGFTGLSRLLVTYIQLSMAILPVFILITTVRSVSGDREAGVFEYMLSLPVPLRAWYWGKLAGRFAVVFVPVFVAMSVAVVWGLVRGLDVRWGLFAVYTGLLMALCLCFLGLGFLISVLARSPDIAQAAAFLIWLVLLLFLDLILLGVLIQEQVPPEAVIGIALVNPLQVFRVAALVLFDPQLVLLGPAAFLVLDSFGTVGFLVWAMVYPAALGGVAAWVGYRRFRKGDLL